MKKSSKFPLSVFFAYIGVISMYLPVSVLGFLAYGEHVTSNILLSIHHNSLDPRAVILDIVLVLITAHLMFSFVIVLNPVSQQAEELFNLPMGELERISGWREERERRGEGRGERGK